VASARGPFMKHLPQWFGDEATAFIFALTDNFRRSHLLVAKLGVEPRRIGN
jgi:hypothetical protein